MFGHHETSATRTLTLHMQTNQSLFQYEIPGVVCLQSKFDLQKTLRFGATAYFWHSRKHVTSAKAMYFRHAGAVQRRQRMILF